MKFNLHTHTPRCRHASGSEREYIETAIAAGIETLGFSDHAPMIFHEDYYSTMRMYPEETAGYFETLQRLRDEYRDRIRIVIGFEAEYYPNLFDDFIGFLSQFPVDYLLLGQHFLFDEIGSPYVARPCARDDYLEAYVRQCCAGMEQGVFTYLAHPDVFCYTGPDAVYDYQMEKLCRKALETGTPLELNILGADAQRSYPRERFWEIAGGIGNVAVLGYDAHCPESLTCDDAERACREMAARCGVPVLESVPLIRPF